MAFHSEGESGFPEWYYDNLQTSGVIFEKSVY